MNGNALPFNSVRSPLFIKLLKVVREYGRGLKPPSYHETRVSLWEKVVHSIQNGLEKYKRQGEMGMHQVFSKNCHWGLFTGHYKWQWQIRFPTAAKNELFGCHAMALPNSIAEITWQIHTLSRGEEAGSVWPDLTQG